ncbi:MAG: hypothetical protein IPJ32_04895 [Sphingobacteriaceae bacterium]|nr:hypothetical protein [Sphingobacteriaceae bacterium]
MNPQPITNLGISNSSFWKRLKLQMNQTEEFNFGISNPILDEVDLYEVSESELSV